MVRPFSRYAVMPVARKVWQQVEYRKHRGLFPRTQCIPVHALNNRCGAEIALSRTVAKPFRALVSGYATEHQLDKDNEGAAPIRTRQVINDESGGSGSLE